MSLNLSPDTEWMVNVVDDLIKFCELNALMESALALRGARGRIESETLKREPGASALHSTTPN